MGGVSGPRVAFGPAAAAGSGAEITPSQYRMPNPRARMSPRTAGCGRLRWTIGAGGPILCAHNYVGSWQLTILVICIAHRRSTLTKQAYKLRLEGLREAKGHIKADTLVRALRALLGTAERATRLVATGRSVAKGRKPAWLRAAMDITVTGLGTGSTTLDIRAPTLGDVLNDDLAQQDFWLQQPDVRDTALDLGARAIAEAQNSSASGDHYDTSVLKEILGLGKAAETRDVRYELSPENPEANGFRPQGNGLCPNRRTSQSHPHPPSFRGQRTTRRDRTRLGSLPTLDEPGRVASGSLASHLARCRVASTSVGQASHGARHRALQVQRSTTHDRGVPNQRACRR